MSNFTPGPWTTHETMRDCVTFQGRNGKENLFLQNLDGYFACQNEADAKLIAAAPDLVRVLQQAHRFLRKQDYNMYEIDLVLAKAGIAT